jgi:hypothetical protein
MVSALLHYSAQTLNRLTLVPAKNNTITREILYEAIMH